MIKLHQWVPRIAAGAFILNEGIKKRSVDDATAEYLHATASGTFEILADWEPRQFVKALSAAEIALGVSLLVPIVPTALVSLALGGFSGGLLATYLRTPGLTDGGVRPTPQGLTMAKDVWLLGIAGGLFVDSVSRGKL